MEPQSKFFDGHFIQREILGDLPKNCNVRFAVISVGDNEISKKYVALKEEAAQTLDIDFIKINFSSTASQEEVIEKIEELNNDSSINAIMIQMPLPKDLDRNFIISKINASKDVDGLRYCSGIESNFLPPVVLSVLEAIKCSDVNLSESRVCLVGKGFLVGAPLLRYFKESGVVVKSLATIDRNTENIGEITSSSDVIISAVGVPRLIKAEMVSDGAVLIDAGTTELNGALIGDIDKAAYKKASYYTPVPGGIGPVTIAMLIKNVLSIKEGF